MEQKSPLLNHDKISQNGNPQVNGNIETKNPDSGDTTPRLRRSERRMEWGTEEELNSELCRSGSPNHPEKGSH